jgi:hypothetical protein
VSTGVINSKATHREIKELRDRYPKTETKLPDDILEPLKPVEPISISAETSGPTLARRMRSGKR